MKTDVFVKFFFREGEEKQAASALEQAFALFRSFEEKFSRFRRGNELWALNENTSVRVSEEMFTLLEQARVAFDESGGLFDPAILPVLEREGYRGAYGVGVENPRHTFGEVLLDPVTRTVRKPLTLKIDLGGIGKGCIVDRVSDFLREYFEHSLVDAGGDIRVRGQDQSQDIGGWAIEIEDPRQTEQTLGILILRDQGVATSGINRRRWRMGAEEKHHLIHPGIGKSAPHDLLTVTAIAETATEADLAAKILFLSGQVSAEDWAEKRGLPAIFVSPETVTINAHAKNLLWQK